MNAHVKEFLKYAALPIILLGLFTILMLVYHFFDLPTYTQINTHVKELFLAHGYWVVFLGALAEGILLASFYLPGSVVVVTGVALAHEVHLSIILMTSFIILAFFITMMINYSLGRFGWYRLLIKLGMGETLERTKKRLEKHGHKIILSSYFHPNFGAFTATSAGILRLPFGRFAIYSGIALIAWNSFWAMVVTLSGPTIINLITLKNLIIFIAFWLTGLMGMFVLKKRQALLTELAIKKPRGFMVLGSIGLGMALIASLPFSSAIVLKWQASDEIYETVDNAPERETALVLGAAAYGDRLSDILKDRVDTAIDLHEAGKVKKLIMSGAENETKAMRRYAITQKVPAEHITEDSAGFNTISSIQNLTGEEGNIVIVTQEYHLPRALFLARHFDINAIGVVADRHEYTKMFEFKKRELLATSKAILDIYLKTDGRQD